MKTNRETQFCNMFKDVMGTFQIRLTLRQKKNDGGEVLIVDVTISSIKNGTPLRHTTLYKLSQLNVGNACQ